jgi:hypothetical protein
MRWAQAAAAAVVALALAAGARGAGPRFLPDDPIAVDNDSAFDASQATPWNLSETLDMAENQFGNPGDHRAIHALNVNTLDEVPDSSWFTNRIGQRPMTLAEVTRGPDIVDRLEVTEWLVTAGKGAAGFQPGFRAVDANDPRPIGERTLYQLELDTEDYPDLATGAEIIGTTLYHAIGYNVVDTYLVNVDPKKVRVASDATLRDASGRRPLTARDIEEIFKLGARNPDGTYRMSAGRFVEGRPMGNFKHYGTRPDDPNDIYPHEHRRELRANRVFGAWINHDDSRALNTLDMMVGTPGRMSIKHYMFDFGSILGSSPDRRWSGVSYMIEKKSTLAGLASFGFWLEPWQFVNYRNDLMPFVGRVEADHFDPAAWKPEYPNQAFKNMQPDDAFWGARIVASFTDDMLAAVVAKAKYRDPRAAEYILSVLKERRDRIARLWMNEVNPLVNFRLAADGTLSFENAAVSLAAATPGTGYTLLWSRFDNATGAHQTVGSIVSAAAESGRLPSELSASEFVAVSVAGHHADHPGWTRPVVAYFRRDGNGWKTVGLERN